MLSRDAVSQACSEICSPAQLLQLLQPELYPDADARLVAQAHSRMFILVKTVTRVRINAAASRASSVPLPLLRRIGAASRGLLRFGPMSFTRRLALLALLLVAAMTVFKLRRGGLWRIVLLQLRLAVHRMLNGKGGDSGGSGS